MITAAAINCNDVQANWNDSSATYRLKLISRDDLLRPNEFSYGQPNTASPETIDHHNVVHFKRDVFSVKGVRAIDKVSHGKINSMNVMFHTPADNRHHLRSMAVSNAGVMNGFVFKRNHDFSGNDNDIYISVSTANTLEIHYFSRFRDFPLVVKASDLKMEAVQRMLKFFLGFPRHIREHHAKDFNKFHKGVLDKPNPFL